MKGKNEKARRMLRSAKDRRRTLQRISMCAIELKSVNGTMAPLSALSEFAAALVYEGLGRATDVKVHVNTLGRMHIGLAGVEDFTAEELVGIVFRKAAHFARVQ